MSLPDDAPDREAEYGKSIGPPSLSGLNWKLEDEVKLNNFLHSMGIFTARQAHDNRVHIQAAVGRILAYTTEAVVQIYGEVEKPAIVMYGPTYEKPKPTTAAPTRRAARR